jgi:hypothetical protein
LNFSVNIQKYETVGQFYSMILRRVFATLFNLCSTFQTYKGGNIAQKPRS